MVFVLDIQCDNGLFKWTESDNIDRPADNAFAFCYTH